MCLITKTPCTILELSDYLKKILVMGLSGSGKTTLSEELVRKLKEINKIVVWFNADTIRSMHNDWDFSYDGRIRQSERMLELSEKNSHYDFVICDFIAPLPEMRKIFSPDILIWMDTVNDSNYKDTDKVFVDPENYDYKIQEKNSSKWATKIVSDICFVKMQ